MSWSTVTQPSRHLAIIWRGLILTIPRTSQAERLLQASFVSCAWDFCHTQRGQVGRPELYIVQHISPRFQMFDQRKQADFRGIGGTREHTLAHKSSAQRYPVKPSDEHAIFPSLYTMGQPGIMQPRIGRDKRCVDPGFFSFCTTAHNCLEIGIHAHFVDTLAHCGSQRTRDVQIVVFQDSTRVRGVPTDSAPGICHRKNPPGISIDDQYWIKWLWRFSEHIRD